MSKNLHVEYIMSSKSCPLSSSADPSDSVLVKLVLSLLQLCKLAANHPGGADILGILSKSTFYSYSMLVLSHVRTVLQVQYTHFFLQRQQEVA